MENLKAKSFDLRKDTVDIIVAGKGGHIGGDMSVIDILISLYFCQMNISPENMDDPGRGFREKLQIYWKEKEAKRRRVFILWGFALRVRLRLHTEESFSL